MQKGLLNWIPDLFIALAMVVPIFFFLLILARRFLSRLNWLVSLSIFIFVGAGLGLFAWFIAFKSGATPRQEAAGQSTTPSSYLHQRRELLGQRISELSDRCNELRQIPGRYALVAVKSTGLPLTGEQAEQKTAIIASVKELQKSAEKQIGIWTDTIEKLHSINRNITETDAPKIDTLIAIVQEASDDIKQTLSRNLATLHVLETTNEFMKDTFAKRDEKIRQINQDFERQVEKINQDFEKKMAKLENATARLVLDDRDDLKVSILGYRYDPTS